MDTRVDPTQATFCPRPWRQVTFLSDGTAVCACIDAARTNPLGNIGKQSFEDIWNGKRYQRLREQIAGDRIDEVPICRTCPNRVAEPPADRGWTTDLPKPTHLYLESVAACNLKCPGCDREEIEGNRSKQLVMDWDQYVKIIDGCSPDLTYMEFHLGGENFMHKKWPEMLAYAKQKNPKLFILTSTNGHYFRTEEERQALVDCGIDAVIFSVDGVTQESYERYRVRGNLDKVLDAMRGVVELRNRAGKQRPIVLWRYILFDWNDSPEEMDQARTMAKELGVDFLTWHLNIAGDYSSKRYYIGSPHLGEIAHELWDNVQHAVTLEQGFDPYTQPREAAPKAS
jgi:MoaA/NifB/PqqE/SkfB family radical SAM enzyme